MVEMSNRDGDGFHLAFGGDTFNTAVYLSRCGVAASYATALGDDIYSAMIAGLARKEGIATDLIEFRKGRVPGLYLIEIDQRGERSFSYWRDSSPARDIFNTLPEKIAGAMKASRLVYLSGITLWLFRAEGRVNLFRAVDEARLAGARIAFDSNFRPRLWQDDVDGAQSAFRAMIERTDIALPTFDDEHLLWGDAHPAATLERLSGWGVPEIVMKLGSEGAVVRSADETRDVPVPAKVSPVDTTAAGDSFNAGYLAGRLFGMAPADAAQAGHKLASAVITHPGAIVPERATKDAVAVKPPGSFSALIAQGT
jgi:2-dehydro-3-deoxygluconokinase